MAATSTGEIAHRERSLRHAVRDGVAHAAMTGAGESYLAAFALMWKASTAQIGWLASLPALVGSFAQLLSAWLGRRFGSRRGLILGGAVAQTITWPLLVVLCVLFPAQAPLLVIGVVTLHHFAFHLAAPQLGSLLGDLVPEDRRGRFFARRTAAATISAFAALVAGGIVLDRFQSAGWVLGGFVAVFGAALVAKGVSVWHLARIEAPPGKSAALEIPRGREWIGRLRASPFVRFALLHALLSLAVSISAPFFAVFMLRDLGFTYVEYMANVATGVFVQFLALRAWGRIADIYGNRAVMRVTLSFITWLPLAWCVSTHYVYLLLLQVVGGLVWSGFSLAAGNYTYDLVPPDKRVTYLALLAAVSSFGVFVGALVGGYAGHAMPDVVELGPLRWAWASPILGVFILSATVRTLLVLVLFPRVRELQPRRTLHIRAALARLLPVRAWLRVWRRRLARQLRERARMWIGPP